MKRKTQPVPRVVEGRALGGYRVYLWFNDGVEGEVDLPKPAPSRTDSSRNE
jgi:hypothetical protein